MSIVYLVYSFKSRAKVSKSVDCLEVEKTGRPKINLGSEIGSRCN